MERKETISDEVSEEIAFALNDPNGILSHQKRLAFCLSLGIVELLERYLKENNALKPGVKVDHRLLKKKRENLIKELSSKLTLNIESLNKLARILDVAFDIESKRNEMVYGRKVSEEYLLGLVNKFLDLKREVFENE